MAFFMEQRVAAKWDRWRSTQGAAAQWNEREQLPPLFCSLGEPNVGRSHCSFVSSKKGLGQGINGPSAQWNRRNTLKLHPRWKPLASGSCGLFRDTGRRNWRTFFFQISQFKTKVLWGRPFFRDVPVGGRMTGNLLISPNWFWLFWRAIFWKIPLRHEAAFQSWKISSLLNSKYCEDIHSSKMFQLGAGWPVIYSFHRVDSWRAIFWKQIHYVMRRHFKVERFRVWVSR